MVKINAKKLRGNLSNVESDIAARIPSMKDYEHDLTQVQTSASLILTHNQADFIDTIIENLLNAADDVNRASGLYNYLCHMLHRDIKAVEKKSFTN